jgi:hypothetical protein
VQNYLLTFSRICAIINTESEGTIMTQAELRQAKANLHYDIVNNILSYGGTWEEDAQMWLYVIELASSELQKNYSEVYKKLLTNH